MHEDNTTTADLAFTALLSLALVATSATVFSIVLFWFELTAGAAAAAAVLFLAAHALVRE